MLLIELNEFSVDFLKSASAGLSTPTLDRLLGWKCSRTDTEDKAERHGLDPWVQWVSIHTGLTAEEHGIRHLAEADQLSHQQIWDALNQVGVSASIWGAMNGRNNRHPLLKTFVPDPWTYSETASPESLNRLLRLPRLYAQDYVKPDRWELSKSTLTTSMYVLTNHVGVVMQNVMRWIRPLVGAGLNNAVLFALFDNLSAKLFRKQCRQDGSDFKLIFLNSIAHLQHHDWNPDSPTVKQVIRLLEDTLSCILDTASPNEPVLLANGFSQICTTERNEFLYRPISPEGFVAAMGLNAERVEQMMTNDGHIFFPDADSCEKGLVALKGATIDGVSAFDVDRRGRRQIFYQFDIWDEIPADASIAVNGKALRFSRHFERLVQRTGSHVSSGHVFHSNIEFPAQIQNHDLFHLIKANYV